MNRRDFLKIAGIAAAGAVVRPASDFVSRVAFAAPPGARSPVPRWAMVVDLRACTRRPDCTDCIVACNEAHNVPAIPTPRQEVKWIWKASFDGVFEDRRHGALGNGAGPRGPVPVLCNHCENPPCVRVCPTGATWKRKDGIVMMDYHRCIGCRYCMAACPYGARSFNWQDPRPAVKKMNPRFPTRTKGVVEKCSFCEERLAQGLQPACVAACREKALIFGDLRAQDSPVTKVLAERYSIWRKPHLGTKPKVFYVV
jgi:molybdopterin-containing oxidoreductase family iron-sulfur binding subunit